MNIGQTIAAEAAIAARRDHEALESMESWLSDMADRFDVATADPATIERDVVRGKAIAYRVALTELRRLMAGGGE